MSLSTPGWPLASRAIFTALIRQLFGLKVPACAEPGGLTSAALAVFEPAFALTRPKSTGMNCVVHEASARPARNALRNLISHLENRIRYFQPRPEDSRDFAHVSSEGATQMIPEHSHTR